MSKIKVGQIYKSNLTLAIKVITLVDDDCEEVSVVHSEGFVDRWRFDDIANCNWELLAEYPTWQEAVNSKEFNNVE